MPYDDAQSPIVYIYTYIMNLMCLLQKTPTTATTFLVTFGAFTKCLDAPEVTFKSSEASRHRWSLRISQTCAHHVWTMYANGSFLALFLIGSLHVWHLSHHILLKRTEVCISRWRSGLRTLYPLGKAYRSQHATSASFPGIVDDMLDTHVLYWGKGRASCHPGLMFNPTRKMTWYMASSRMLGSLGS